ncbi:MAG: hypothetical protein WA354_24695 [Terracidiphilus sp.]
MLKIACVCLMFAAGTPLWSQVEPSGSGGGGGLGDSRMMTPAPVGGGGYPGNVGSEERSNYLAGGLIFTGAYVDNLMLENGAKPISDETYSFLPSIGFDRGTARQHQSLSYSTGFTLYQHTSDFNSVTQNAAGRYQFRISPYTVLTLGDTFSQNNNLYNQSNPFASNGISGTPGQSNQALISPYQNQLANSSNADIHYQYAKNAMIGASGSYSLQQFSGSVEFTGLNNEGTAGASGFFSRRIAGAHYVGATYQFSKFVTHPIGTYTVTQTIFGFYTYYFNKSFSLSVLGGPEHYTFWGAGTPSQGAWSPAIQLSLGWQTRRTNLAASYSHIVSGAGGLIGTYHSDTASLSGRYAFSRTWGFGANVSYGLFDNVNSTAAVVYGNGGNSIFGGVNADHRITDRLSAQAGYGHFHQDYPGIPGSATYPDSNRVNISLMYQFNRPLGR